MTDHEHKMSGTTAGLIVTVLVVAFLSVNIALTIMMSMALNRLHPDKTPGDVYEKVEQLLEGQAEIKQLIMDDQ